MATAHRKFMVVYISLQAEFCGPCSGVGVALLSVNLSRSIMINRIMVWKREQYPNKGHSHTYCRFESVLLYKYSYHHILYIFTFVSFLWEKEHFKIQNINKCIWGPIYSIYIYWRSYFVTPEWVWCDIGVTIHLTHQTIHSLFTMNRWPPPNLALKFHNVSKSIRLCHHRIWIRVQRLSLLSSCTITVEQTAELPVLLDVIMLIRHHCYEKVSHPYEITTTYLCHTDDFLTAPYLINTLLFSHADDNIPRHSWYTDYSLTTPYDIGILLLCHANDSVSHPS